MFDKLSKRNLLYIVIIIQVIVLIFIVNIRNNTDTDTEPYRGVVAPGNYVHHTRNGEFVRNTDKISGKELDFYLRYP